ncbi:TPA: hypothetical protein QDC20_006715 [Burkholderia aenigmatica]|uniref:hypothetical protein n=1 Tax=Burkholderia sp. AU45251 TaxID=3059204 RepID=UPI002651BD66|nr:hypothetical protein [Burkholderia sp. AU45251]HDR9483611.1 hypothetical protein [Burkholderia aenigmatica]MDN7514548.1 hypothetical protein [Burkholderia sp. AU45251]HDR9515157.1 hypothetical protein [Burkholderia aenigmatica]HDR9592242.1 hypothetical protein [Burkholderia aenigmatica]HDR9600371.1 hypothetical protein [Burkholderia aenigmatica]
MSGFGRRTTDDGIAHADEQMDACVGAAVDMIGTLIEDMFEIGIVDRADAERIKSMMDRNIEKARKGEP